MLHLYVKASSPLLLFATATLTHVMSIAAAVVLIGGIVAVGALRTAAFAWREERDAEIAKNRRLEDEKAQLKETTRLQEQRILELERRTNLAQFEAKLDQLVGQVHAVTAAVELLAKSSVIDAALQDSGG